MAARRRTETCACFVGRERVLRAVQVDRLLAQAADSWSFDTYALEEATDGHPLSVLAFWLLSTSGCTKDCNVSPTTLARFLRRAEAGYSPSNPYHNARHAADVLQTLHMVMHRGGLMPGYVADPHTVLSCYLTAIIHDYEHRGLSTDFLTASNDALAVSERVCRSTTVTHSVGMQKPGS